MNIIKGWQNCSIDLFYKIDDILKDESLTSMQKNVKLISSIFDIDEDDVYKMDIEDYNKYIQQLQWLNEPNVNQKYSTSKVKIDDVTYIVTPIRKLTIAQYIDFQTFWQKKDLRVYIGNILASFLVPKGHKYGEGYDIVEVANIFRNNLDILTAHNLLFFFLKRYLDSMVSSFIYLRKMMKNKKDIENTTEALKIVLDGLHLSK